MAPGKNLSGGIDDSDIQRSWEKTKSGPKKRKQGDTMLAAGKKIAPSPMDSLPIEVQMTTEPTIENQNVPLPESAMSDYEVLATRLRLLDDGFEALPDGAKEDDCSVLPDSEPKSVKPLVLKLRPVPSPQPEPEPEPCGYCHGKTTKFICPASGTLPEPGQYVAPPDDDFGDDVVADDGSEDLEQEEAEADSFFREEQADDV